MLGWERALDVFGSGVDVRVRWMLVGSAATRVQGVAVEPGDVDVLVHPDSSEDELHAVAGTLASYTAAGPASQGLDQFLSTPDQQLVATPDGTWLFGRWTVEGCKLEVARIRVDVGPTAVVPLEVQLATIVSRGLDERAHAVRARLAECGPDEALMSRAMADRGMG